MSATRDFWASYQVASFNDGFTAEHSIEMLRQRRETYPEMAALMLPKQSGTVLDFGCGPGHDTIEFLLAGAEHVFAADFSPAAIESARSRLRAHGFEERATLVLTDDDWEPPLVDHVHAAGVVHHCADPAGTLCTLASALKSGAEIRMMAYCSLSAFYRVKCGGDPDVFRYNADAGAPIADAWTQGDVERIASDAGLTSTYLGSYKHPGETVGDGLSACYSLRRP